MWCRCQCQVNNLIIDSVNSMDMIFCREGYQPIGEVFIGLVLQRLFSVFICLFHYFSISDNEMTSWKHVYGFGVCKKISSLPCQSTWVYWHYQTTATKCFNPTRYSIVGQTRICVVTQKFKIAIQTAVRSVKNCAKTFLWPLKNKLQRKW